MLNRRMFFAATLLAPAAHAAQTGGDWDKFIAGVKADARKLGVRQSTLDRAFIGVKMNQRVIDLDRRQPEFTLTWAQYRDRIVSADRISRGREAYRKHRTLMDAVCAKYRVPAGPILGIWGLESDYGRASGGFNVIEALATLTWEGRRATFFRSELMDALKILDAGDISPDRMIGSYAGAMGQGQFMPDSFLKFAVNWDGHGKRDLWSNYGDIFASIANYLAKSGYTDALPLALPITLPAGFDPAITGHANRRPLSEWGRLGIAVPSHLAPSTQAAVILPGGEAFLAIHPNYLAIRRYNPSDFYSLSVSLIGNAVTA
jgi:membrane-bound lytic murein transglycosylase B